MAYVKLDCGMLDSTLWIDRCARELFITALLMAEPIELPEPAPTIKIASLEPAEFVVPAGWYGFVAAAGTGIIHRCGMDPKSGMQALERLSEPEAESRTPDHEGRRMVRIDGGYIILNYDKYRQKDHTSAERSRRYREKKASRVTTRLTRVASRSVTQAEAEVQADKKRVGANGSHPTSISEEEWRQSLLSDPAYQHIDVRAEFSKMQRWCEVNKKQPTRRRFINWLNRIERPMRSMAATRTVKPQQQFPQSAEITDEQAEKNKAFIAPLMADLKAKLASPTTQE